MNINQFCVNNLKMIIINNYIIMDILSYLPLKKLIEMELLSTSYRDIIRKNNLSHLTIKLNKIENIKYVTKHYNFIKYDFAYSYITDVSVKLLGNCHTLNLLHCDQITNDSVKYLGNCHTLNLFCCNKITDESVKLLGNCHKLDLTGCYQITDESVKFLGKCHTLNLSYCHQITDESIKFLGNCHELHLCGCKQITNERIKLLEKCNTLYSWCRKK